MPYLRYIAGSPKLIAQLLLLTVIAGAIGGTGLFGLFTARAALNDITVQHVPALVNLLNAQRDIDQANYAGLSAILDPDVQRRDQVELPRIKALSAAAATDFQQFHIDPKRRAVEAPLVDSVGRLLVKWRAAAAQAQLLSSSSAKLSPAIVLAAYTIVNTTIVNPLEDELRQLVRYDLDDVNQARDSAFTSTRNATLLLWGVIVLAVLLAGAFQVTMSAREYRRRAFVEQTGDLVVVVDRQGKILFASPSYERLLGYKPAKLVGRVGFELIHPAEREVLAAALADRIENDMRGSREIEIRFLHANGTYRWLVISGVNKLNDPLVAGIVVTGRDITERKETEAALEFQAAHDPLTALPNRFLLQESIEHALTAAAADGTAVSLLILDLNRFKEINDGLGHAIGDLLLLEVGNRLAQAVRSNDFVARAGGDQFAVLSREAGEASAQGLANRLVQGLVAPFLIAGRTLSVDACIGIASFPAHGENPQALLQRAEAAMYEAKQKQESVVVYSAVADAGNIHRLALGQELRQAIQNSELMLHYQPKIDPVEIRLVGVEALVRWNHPVHGFIAPDQFIPLAEQNGLIEPLTVWVLETAARQCKAWQGAGWSIPVAVNLSARTLQNLQFPSAVADLLARHDLPAGSLTLEITESSVMSDPIRAIEVMSRLHLLGVRLSIDDFGTGYSSLGYLKELPVQEVKIDKSFVLGLGGASDTKNAAIVRSIIALAHALRLKVVAEGVEDGDTQNVLADLKCDTIQGYHISRPLAAADFEEWMRSRAVEAGAQTEGGPTRPLAAVA